jgi:glycogen synthase
VHVLITADTVGGVWTYTRELACGLLDHGHRVTLVSFGGEPTAAQGSWLRRKNLSFYPTTFPLEWMEEAQPGIDESMRFLEKIVRATRPELLHLNQFCYGCLKADVPKLVVAHSDVVSWWRSVHHCDPPRTEWFSWYASVVTEGLHSADAVVTPSEWMLDAIEEIYGPLPNARVIHNGRTPTLFRPAEGRTCSVLSVGRVWDKAKQVSLLLARDLGIPVRIAGSLRGPEASAASPLEAVPSANVRFYGELDQAQLSKLYSESAIYVAASCYEPFGLSPLEAALSRCALVANDVPVFHELWGDSALYFQKNDPDDLAAVILRFAEQIDLRELYATRAYNRARSCFTATRMVAQYEGLYISLVRERSAA